MKYEFSATVTICKFVTTSSSSSFLVEEEETERRTVKFKLVIIQQFEYIIRACIVSTILFIDNKHFKFKYKRNNCRYLHLNKE
jgi:hypothetical protein